MSFNAGEEVNLFDPGKEERSIKILKEDE